MKILQRYIIHEIWLPALLCFLTLNFIFMGGYLVQAANFIIGRGVPLTDTLYVLILALPDMISYTVPTSLLTAVLIVYGSLSQNNEIRAVKASGIHPLFIMTPAFLIGLLVTLAMFVFNDQIASNASFESRRATKKILIKHPNALIEPGRFVKISENVTFLAKEMQGDTLRDIVAYETEDGDKPVRTVMAERGEIYKNPKLEEIKIRLYDGSISDAEEASVQSIQFKTYEFPTVGQEDLQKMRKKTRELSLAELLLRLEKADLSEEDRLEVWSCFHHKIAFSFGSFLFVFLGIPVAILVHRGETILSFAISMAVVGVYYVLYVAAKSVALQGALPPVIAFWIPNLLLFWLGFYLQRRAYVS